MRNLPKLALSRPGVSAPMRRFLTWIGVPGTSAMPVCLSYALFTHGRGEAGNPRV